MTMRTYELRQAKIRLLDARLGELRWVDRQMQYPNEVADVLWERIEKLERELRRLVIAVGDDDE